MSSDNQGHPNRMTNNTYSCGLHFHSSGEWGMQKCHSMRKDEIDCYIIFGHLVEVQGKRNHHGYVNIFQQHLLTSADDIFDIQKANVVF